jgi:hypothetical protein
LGSASHPIEPGAGLPERLIGKALVQAAHNSGTFRDIKRMTKLFHLSH